MYDELLDLWKKKKEKKGRIVAFSYINKLVVDIYKNHDIDVYRFDIDEFANIYGYKDKNRIDSSEIISLIKHMNRDNNSENYSKLIAVDVPLSLIFGDENCSIKSIVYFYKDTDADLLVFDLDFNILELAGKLAKMKMPFIIYSRNKFKKDQKNYLQEAHNSLMEAESKGALMLILEGYPLSFVQHLKTSVLIPVITNEKNTRADGFYARFSDVFGLNPESINKYLNLYDLVNESVNDCIMDNE